MKVALHAGCIPHCNVVTQIEAARSAGFDGIELQIPIVERYLRAGFTIDELRALLGPLRLTMFDVLLGIERSDPTVRENLRASCARAAAIAAALGCSALQVVALQDFDEADASGRRRRLVSSLRELADSAAPLGVRLALEPVTFSPFRALDEAAEVVAAVGLDRVGLVLDTWHLWTSGTPWDDLRQLDASVVVCAHLSDSGPARSGEWSDDDRTVLPGDGVVPLDEAVDAVATTGFDGVWSVEMHSGRHAEWHPQVLADALLKRALRLLAT